MPNDETQIDVPVVPLDDDSAASAPADPVPPVDAPVPDPETVAMPAQPISDEPSVPVSDVSTADSSSGDTVTSVPVVKSAPMPAPPLATAGIDPGSKFTANMLRWRDLLKSALAKRKSTEQKKLDGVLALAARKKRITSTDVREFLRVSDSAAERYLSELVRAGKLRPVGAAHSPHRSYELVA